MVKTFQKSWKSFVILVTCLVIMVEHLKQSVKEQVVPRRNSELGGVLLVSRVSLLSSDRFFCTVVKIGKLLKEKTCITIQ